jgi:zona occludens toxin (predicted ATPase)
MNSSNDPLAPDAESNIDSADVLRNENPIVQVVQGAEEDALLFVDEADALFGKRTEVKDSHDRYADDKK